MTIHDGWGWTLDGYENTKDNHDDWPLSQVREKNQSQNWKRKNKKEKKWKLSNCLIQKLKYPTISFEFLSMGDMSILHC